MLTLQEVAKVLNLHSTSDVNLEQVSTDTRNLKPGSLFVALKGENFDGHDFVSVAEKKGALAIIVSSTVDTSIPLLKVEDTRKALGKIAAHHRSKFDIPLIALTGSCGKTTTKTMLATILSQEGNTLAPLSSFNNDVGVPLTLLNLNNAHQYAVIEMGANQLNEIAYLCELARPTISVITNVAPAHLQGFGTIENVAATKGQIYEALAPDGIAIVNADDALAKNQKHRSPAKQSYSFSIDGEADFTAKNIVLDKKGMPSFCLITPSGEFSVKLSILGHHNVYNALAAAACAYAAGISKAAIKTGLESFQPVAKRLVCLVSPEGSEIIDDSYNANPLSVAAALSILAKKEGEKIFVFGDMGELGPDAVVFHEAVGQKAQALGIDKLFTYGQLSEYTARAFGKNAWHFESQADLILAVRKCVRPNVVILVKGSRSAHMENVVQALVNSNG